MNKVIILDWGIYIHRAINSLRKNPTIPAPYTCLNMIIGDLKKIGIDKEDITIVAVDFLRSWRKTYAEEYKADRAKKREEDKQINWKEEYKKMNELLDNIEEATDWHIIKIEHLEADDIMAVASRYYKDKEVILATYDSDLEQMWHYPNIKIFSPKSKRYKIPPKNFNAFKLIAKKIEKEVSDNLVSPILNKADYEARKTCVNLLDLPSWVEESITKQLDNINPKTTDLELLWFDSLRKRFNDIYKKDKVESYEHSIKYKERKEKRKKKLKEAKK